MLMVQRYLIRSNNKKKKNCSNKGIRNKNTCSNSKTNKWLEKINFKNHFTRSNSKVFMKTLMLKIKRIVALAICHLKVISNRSRKRKKMITTLTLMIWIKLRYKVLVLAWFLQTQIMNYCNPRSKRRWKSCLAKGHLSNLRKAQ